MNDETLLYNQTKKGMNEKAVNKLSQHMAHGYEIRSLSGLTVLQRESDGNIILLNKDGSSYKCIPVV